MPGMPVMTTAPSPPTSQSATPGAGSITPEGVKQQYSGYSLEQAQREGYKPDGFCLSATDFGLPATLGAIFHATDESRLMGPIVANRPQALVFDQTNRVIAVEYEVMADAVSAPPQLFGQTFHLLPPHPGIQHQHYALHLWFSDNPNGQFADFNPRLSLSGRKRAEPASSPGAW